MFRFETLPIMFVVVYTTAQRMCHRPQPTMTQSMRKHRFTALDDADDVMICRERARHHTKNTATRTNSSSRTSNVMTKCLRYRSRHHIVPKAVPAEDSQLDVRA